MLGDGIGELLGERAELVDLARQRIGEDVGIVGSVSTFSSAAKPAADFGHLAGEIGVAARELEKAGRRTGRSPASDS